MDYFPNTVRTIIDFEKQPSLQDRVPVFLFEFPSVRPNIFNNDLSYHDQRSCKFTIIPVPAVLLVEASHRSSWPQSSNVSQLLTHSFV